MSLLIRRMMLCLWVYVCGVYAAGNYEDSYYDDGPNFKERKAMNYRKKNEWQKKEKVLYKKLATIETDDVKNWFGKIETIQEDKTRYMVYILKADEDCDFISKFKKYSFSKKDNVRILDEKFIGLESAPLSFRKKNLGKKPAFSVDENRINNHLINKRNRVLHHKNFPGMYYVSLQKDEKNFLNINLDDQGKLRKLDLFYEEEIESGSR